MDQERRTYCETCRRADPSQNCDDCPDERFRPVVCMPENRDPWRLFLACHTQVRQGGMGGGITGLDYAGVAAVASWMQLDLRVPRLLDGLQHLEAEWLQALRKLRKPG